MYVITWTWLFRCNSPHRCLLSHCLNPLRLVDLLRQGRRAEDLRHIALEERIKEIREKVWGGQFAVCPPKKTTYHDEMNQLTTVSCVFGKFCQADFSPYVSYSFKICPPVVCWVKPCNPVDSMLGILLGSAHATDVILGAGGTATTTRIRSGKVVT